MAHLQWRVLDPVTMKLGSPQDDVSERSATAAAPSQAASSEDAAAKAEREAQKKAEKKERERAKAAAKAEKYKAEKEAKKAETKAAEATGASPAPAAPEAPTVLDHDEGIQRIWQRLKQLGLAPIKDPIGDTEVERPTAHSTHNLLLKDTKTKQLFLVTMAQAVKAKMNDISALIGAKQVRMADPKATQQALSVHRPSCITALSLYNNTSTSVEWYVDEEVLAMDTLRICAGCNDPLDHSQHMIVDIKTADLLAMLAESGHIPKPITFQ